MKLSKRIEAARALYVAGKSITEIAQILGVNHSTISRYKSADEKNWDVLRNQHHLLHADRDKEVLYGDFVSYMYDSIREIREDETLPVAKKTEAIVKLGDAFSKMKRIAAAEDPENYAKGIVKLTIQRLVGYLRAEEMPAECMQKIADTIMKYQDEIADVTI